MGLFDKAKDALNDNKDKIDSDQLDGGIDKAGDFADEKTGGKYGEHIDKGQDFAKDKGGDFLGNEGGGENKNPA